ncbi:alpha/beta fold hydrolase [Citricoccus sp.]|uniref:alpha/beta fold hydrolase n=1 Tax=Citricoccus sp. TaxID=1978372 RepID=UPI0026301E33|nr:alpha/beta fold hydrolase [Citricoccus sp.]HRO29790.1 alpha/beta fold hydrolase [Citricoccus sp.]HRO94138.1 alpha/beta fold hydrolase [Citricoccus sp.]
MTEATESVPVVLLHGVGLDRTMWGPVVDLLDAAGLQVEALDLPGHGGQPPLRRPTDLAEMAQNVVERISETRVHLVGFSLGALVAQRIAVDHPDRVVTLTCISTVCRRTDEESAAVRRRLETAGEDFATGVDRALDRWYPPEAAVSDAQRQATRATLLANDRQSYLHAYAVFATGDQQIAPDLHRIHAPTLAVTGELDPGSTPEMTHRLATAVPHGRAVVVPGVRHMLPAERPEVLVEHLQHHLASSEQHPEGAHHG